METVTTRIGQASAPLSSADGLVTANHLLAAEAGATILGQGGNAVDAAIATSFAVGVVEPSSSGVAGRGYLIIHLPSTGESVVFDGHERAPLAARPDMYRLVDPEAVPTSGWGPQVKVVDDANIVGHRAVAVPGVVPALHAAHQRFGRLPWSALFAPAIALAEDGLEVSESFAASLARQRAKLSRFPATAELFLPAGEPLAVGARYRNPDLAGACARSQRKDRLPCNRPARAGHRRRAGTWRRHPEPGRPPPVPTASLGSAATGYLPGLPDSDRSRGDRRDHGAPGAQPARRVRSRRARSSRGAVPPPADGVAQRRLRRSTGGDRRPGVPPGPVPGPRVEGVRGRTPLADLHGSGTRRGHPRRRLAVRRERSPIPDSAACGRRRW